MSRRDQFFHGGSADLQPGDLVLPSRVTGNQNTGNGTSYAWATRDPVKAVSYASTASERHGVPGHVYKVRPIDGDYGADDATNMDMGRETGWQVESHAWSTDDFDREHVRAYRSSQWKQDVLATKRAKIKKAYDRDSKLTRDEREAKESALDEVEPGHAQRRKEFDETVARLAELLTARWP